MRVPTPHPHRRARTRAFGLRAALVAALSVALAAGGLVPAATAATAPPLVAATSSGTSVTTAIGSGTAPSAVSAWAQTAVDTAIRPAHLIGFDPGNLIDDALFYDGRAMTAAEIQRFLDQRIGICNNGRCLNVSTTSISSRPARVSQATGNVVCNAISGGTMRVSELIYRVQVACGISAKVILVTLQKEQGLTTSRAPSDWNLRAAMGAYCPDTAPCDPGFAGVGPQIVAGVTQLKMYRAGAFSRQPGTHFITYHPDASRGCGGTTVRVSNHATAALYNYTPYQPNAAALRAGLGEGDRCSSYGNRNFYNYYTDWFGPAKSTANALVTDNKDVWVASGSERYHVTQDIYPEYLRFFGAPTVVTANQLGQFRNAGKASLFVHDSGAGVVAYLQGGQSHRFPSCALVTSWGGSCASLTQLTSADFTRGPRGAEMTSFTRVASSSRIHRMDGSTLTPMWDGATAAAYNGGKAPYAPTLPASVAKGRTIGAVKFAPAEFLSVKGRGGVWLPQNDNRLLKLRSWAQAREFGLQPKAVRGVSAADAKPYSMSTSLSEFVTCAGTTFYAADGTLRRVEAGAAAGFPVTSLDALTCSRLKRSTAAALPTVFVQGKGQNPVYIADNGTYRHVSSPEQLRNLGGGKNPVVLTVSATTIKELPHGTPFVAQGDLLRAASKIFVVDDTKVIQVPNMALARAMGLTGAVRDVKPQTVQAYARDPRVLASFVRCKGEVYAAGSGSLVRVTNPQLGGNPVTDLGPKLCGNLNLQRNGVDGRVFLTDGTRTAASSAGGFQRLTSAADIARANGGSSPKTIRVSVEYLRTLKAPTSLPKSGDLIAPADRSEVYLVDGTSLLHLPSWAIGDAMGLRARLKVVPAIEAIPYKVATSKVSPVINCGSKYWIAQNGMLRRIDKASLGGLPSTSISVKTCGALPRSQSMLSGALVVQSTSSNNYFVAAGGGLRPLRAGESLESVNGGKKPTVIRWASAVILSLPMR